MICPMVRMWLESEVRHGDITPQEFDAILARHLTSSFEVKVGMPVEVMLEGNENG